MTELLYENVSIVNSTTTPLNAGATWTGEWELCSNYPSVMIAVATNQNGSFAIQYSSDGTNLESTLTRYYRTTMINAPHRFTNTRKYCRATFTNTSASNQTYLRLQTCYGNYTNLNAPIDSTLSRNFDAMPTRPTDFRTEVALGRRQGCETWNKFGYNEDADTGTEVIASFGGTYIPLTTASTLRFVSTSTDDGAGGIGARSLVVYGIDGSYNQVTAVVALDGTTNVDTVTTWLGINRIAIYLSGTNKSNVGTLTVTAINDGSTQAQMPIGQGTSQQLIFHVPVNEQALASYLTFGATKLTSGTAPRVTFKMWVYSAVSNSKYEVFRYQMDTTVENSVQISPPEPFVIGEKSTIWAEITTDTLNTVCNGRFSLILHEDIDF